ncbi:TIGR02186 family protein [Oricola cellulosilytica]|uniref:TIGR02186 family protein n=1 Tax=Oricola cellulosilytica TaxID=1429082 RepID=A0A4R0PJH0_9HYPH|nr:TIGR02186 family protein [Oricola cellulosilytica]TCD16540.1 TIGR02186 family protein [Oricola cellulosilytica]
MRALVAAAAMGVALVSAPPADAQEEPEGPLLAAPIPPERIEIGLSTETIAITSDFAGVGLTIFGAIDNVDPLIQRQGRYDVFVILEGPSSNIVTRRKSRVLGIWMNVESQSFLDVPQSFLVASTRQARDITTSSTLDRLSLGVEEVRLRPGKVSPRGKDDVTEFTEALRRLKENSGLYQEFPSGVRFISQSLFRAQLHLPADVPLGRHTARAYLFRAGTLSAQTTTTLDIRKAGLEYQLFQAAQNQSLLYGIAAVAFALFIGWLGRVLFRRD